MEIYRLLPGIRNVVRAVPLAIIAAVGLAAPVQSGVPPTGGDFTLRRSTIDAGGDDSDGAGFSLRGTIGQPDATVMQAGGFTLRGGFWTPSGPSDFVFSDGFE